MPPLNGCLRLTNFRLVLRAGRGGGGSARGARHRVPRAFEELHIPYGVSSTNKKSLQAPFSMVVTVTTVT